MKKRNFCSDFFNLQQMLRITTYPQHFLGLNSLMRSGKVGLMTKTQYDNYKCMFSTKFWRMGLDYGIISTFIKLQFNRALPCSCWYRLSKVLLIISMKATNFYKLDISLENAHYWYFFFLLRCINTWGY